MIRKYITGNFYRILSLCFLCKIIFTSNITVAQVPIFVETFGQTAPGACDAGTLANGFPAQGGGNWTVTPIGLNDSAANEWFISAAEPGLNVNTCSLHGCRSNSIFTNRTLHVGNVPNSPNALTGVICSTGDCGAVYDPGGWQNAVQTNKRVESPAFSMPGNTINVLTFNYIEYGDTPNDTDKAVVVFWNGVTWMTPIASPPPTNICGPAAVEWQKFVVNLPTLASTTNVKIGFVWTNNNGGFGTNPSFAVDSIVVFTSNIPVANITVSDTNVCVNDPVNFFADSAGAGATYSWTFNGASTPTSTLQNPANIMFPNPGTFTVQLIVSNFSGSDTANITITANPCIKPTANFSVSDSNFCERSCITFTDQSINGPTGWNWFFPGGTPSSSSLPAPPPVCYTTPGVYDVTLIAFNQFGADTLVKTAYLTVNSCPLPVADFNSTLTQSCPQHCVTFTDNSAFGPILSYQWFFPGGTPDTSSAASPNICYTSEGLYDVEYIATNQYGSDSILKYSEVNVQFVNGAFASPDTEMFFGSSYQMFAGGGVSYSWSPATGLDSATIPNPVASPTVTTTYTVSITDASGCTSERQVHITILHLNNVYVPNSFSPNGDGRNDYLIIRGNNLYGVRLTVFDRWGEKVFESTSQYPGWDGKYNGKDLDPGVFTYIATINYNDKNTVTETGTVTLVR